MINSIKYNAADDMEMQRLFIAIPLPSSIKQELHRWILMHKQQLSFRKWTHTDDLHITLQFLGDTSPQQLEQLCHALNMIKQPAFQLQLSNSGIFGSAAAPRILWMGVAGELQALAQLQQQVVKHTKQCGFAAEERSYRPHITLARYYEKAKCSEDSRHTNSNKQSDNPSSLQQLLLSSPPNPMQWQVNQFTVMKTTLNKQPSYSTLHGFLL